MATLCGGSAPAPLANERDPDLADGIHMVKEGDFENAVVKLDAAVRGLEAAGRSAESAQAYLYLGVAYLELDQEALARGVALVHAELQNTLARAGVEPFDPLGEKFDPQSSEAISTRQADGEAAGTVVETLERGYRLDGDVLRPARVIVSE